jgi:methyltransferase family protein
MASPLSDAVVTQFKRVRGDDVLLRSERSLSNDLAAAEKAIRADLAALSVQVEALKPPIPEASPLKAAKPAIRSLFEHPRPQMPAEAVTYIADRLTSEMTLLEWGGGASTPYFCERVGVLHTVEASPEWALILLDHMSHRADLVDRWRLHYVGANWTTVRAERRRNGSAMPEADLRHRMEDDYALMIADRVDAIVVDGSVRQRTVARVADYIRRDRPGLLVVNAMDTDYIAEAVAKLDLAGYDCRTFSGDLQALDGRTLSRSTYVWVRRDTDDGSAEAVHHEITEVWESHDDEQYRQDQSHWRGVGRWNEEKWTEWGQGTAQRMEELHHAAHRNWSSAAPPVVLEWGPGGGANLYGLASRVSTMYGVDISAKNLEETGRVLAEIAGSHFVPILLDGEPSTVVGLIDRPVDLFFSTAVFQHFPSREYGAEVLRTVRQLMAPGGLGYVQIRFDDGTDRYRPKSLAEYRERHLTATSYSLSGFWDLLLDSGFRPLQIANVNTKVNYARFYFAVAD